MSTSRSFANMTGCFLAGAAVSIVVIRCMQQRHDNLSAGGRRPPTKTRGSKSSTAAASSPRQVPKELREEQLSRHTLYFGHDGMDSIRSSNVCIVGLGGVGSHAALMLARGGVEQYLRLIDFDQVTLSSLNRHACATLKDVGIPKVVCVQNMCQELGLLENAVDARVEMYTTESGPNLLALGLNKDGKEQKWDVVIDCIDDVPTKAALLTFCIQNSIRVFSCMGAGGKSDMTRLHISDLRTASRDPLASKLRQTLKKTMKAAWEESKRSTSNCQQQTQAIQNLEDSYLDDMDQLTIIYSSEKTVMKLADLTEEQKTEGDKTQFGAVDGMRIRVLPVLGPLPAIMGQSLAAMTLCELGKKPIHHPVTGERVGKNVRQKIYHKLMNRELKIASGELKVSGGASYSGPLEIDGDDVEYLLGVWRNRCGVTGARLGTVLQLVRWDMSKPATTYNLVLICSHALDAYDKRGKDSIPASVQKRIENRLAGCRDLNAEI